MKGLMLFLLTALASCHHKIPPINTITTKTGTTAKSISAKTTSGMDTQPDKYKTQFEQGIDFIASGTEPFWSLEIDFDKSMHFKTVSGFDITTPAVTGVKAMDANVTRYAAETEKGSLIIQITKLDCINDMSGVKSSYNVTIDAKYNTGKSNSIYKGCGQYLYDYRINDIWLLEIINKKKIIAADFAKGLPQLEINIAQQKVFGHTGCNNMTGAMELQGKKIRFGNLASTRMACANMEFENKYLHSLANYTIPYSIETGRLQLHVTPDSTYVYRKID